MSYGGSLVSLLVTVDWCFGLIQTDSTSIDIRIFFYLEEFNILGTWLTRHGWNQATNLDYCSFNACWSVSIKRKQGWEKGLWTKAVRERVCNKLTVGSKGDEWCQRLWDVLCCTLNIESGIHSLMCVFCSSLICRQSLDLTSTNFGRTLWPFI